jgi:transcriptional regulator with XRE-family HTH domain
MKQQTLAEAVGYETHAIIAKIEGGLTLPSFDKAVAIAAALGVSLDSLLTDAPSRAQDFPALTRLLKSTPRELQHAWIAVLKALADDLDDLERQENAP